MKHYKFLGFLVYLYIKIYKHQNKVKNMADELLIAHLQTRLIRITGSLDSKLEKELLDFIVNIAVSPKHVREYIAEYAKDIMQGNKYSKKP